MSKITRDQVFAIVRIEWVHLDKLTEAIIALIDQREAEFQELVDGVGHLLERWNTPGELNITGLRKAYNKLCPPPDPHKVLADRLNNVTSRYEEGCHVPASDFREIAAEIEKLGGGDENT